MNHIGQAITWGTVAAPHLFTGKCTSYTARDAATRQMFDDEAGDNTAFILHSRKTEINFGAEITSGSVDFLDISAGAVVTVTGIASGIVAVSRAVETWRLQQRKTAQISATWFPDMTQAGPQTAGTLTSFTPDQSGLGITHPGGTQIWGTYGITHSVGIVHGLTIEQQLTLAEDEVSPAGTILGVKPIGYLRTIQLELLATGAIPAVGATLTLATGPANTANYVIESAEVAFADKRGKMFNIGAVWIPPLG